MSSNEEVAQRLGVTATGLRRLADIYGEVYGPLQRDEKFNNRRLWTLEAVERIAAARALVQSEQARSIKTALHMVEQGITAPAEELSKPSTPQPQEVLMRAILERIEGLEVGLRVVDQLQEEVQIMRRQLEAPKEGVEVSPQLQEVLELNRALALHLETPKDDSRERELEVQVADLEQRNRAMLGELERRRVEAEQEQTLTPWWRRWLGR
jgi:hypothetical protein